MFFKSSARPTKEFGFCWVHFTWQGLLWCVYHCCVQSILQILLQFCGAALAFYESGLLWKEARSNI